SGQPDLSAYRCRPVVSRGSQHCRFRDPGAVPELGKGGPRFELASCVLHGVRAARNNRVVSPIPRASGRNNGGSGGILTSANTVEREPASAGTAAASLSANALAVTAARLLVPALNLALVVGIARLGGVESLGSYTVLVTLFLILENVKTLGLTSMLVRDVAADAHAALAVYSSLVRISLIGAVLCVPIMVGGATFANGVHPASVLPASIMAFGLFPSAYALVNDALFLALGRARYSTAIA